MTEKNDFVWDLIDKDKDWRVSSNEAIELDKYMWNLSSEELENFKQKLDSFFNSKENEQLMKQLQDFINKDFKVSSLVNEKQDSEIKLDFINKYLSEKWKIKNTAKEELQNIGLIGKIVC